MRQIVLDALTKACLFAEMAKDLGENLDEALLILAYAYGQGKWWVQFRLSGGHSQADVEDVEAAVKRAEGLLLGLRPLTPKEKIVVEPAGKEMPKIMDIDAIRNVVPLGAAHSRRVGTKSRAKMTLADVRYVKEFLAGYTAQIDGKVFDALSEQLFGVVTPENIYQIAINSTWFDVPWPLNTSLRFKSVKAQRKYDAATNKLFDSR